MAKDDLGKNARFQRELNRLFAARLEMLREMDEILRSQADMSSQMKESLEEIDVSGLEDQFGDLRDAISDAADEAERLDGAKSGGGLFGAKKSMGGFLTGAKSGFMNFTAMVGNAALSIGKLTASIGSTLFNVVKGTLGVAWKLFKGLTSIVWGATKAIFSLAASLAKVGASMAVGILSVPFKIYKGLIAEATQSGGGSQYAIAKQNIKKAFGNLSNELSSSVFKGFKGMRRSIGRFGRSAGESLDEFRERVAEGLGPALYALRGEVEANGKDFYRFVMGLNLSKEATAGLGARMLSTGKSIGQMSVEVTTLAKTFSFITGSFKVMGRMIMEAAGDFKNFGTLSIEAIAKSTAYVAALGLEMKDVLGVLDAFDDFPDAAKKVSQLSQAFGMHVDVLEMINAQDPASRFDALRKSFLATGKSVNDLTRQELKLLAAQTGLDEKAIKVGFSAKNQGLSLDQVNKKAAAGKKKTLSQAEAMDKLAKAIERMVKSGSRQGGIFANFLRGFTVGVKRSKEMRGMFRNIRSIIRVAYRWGKKLGRLFVEVFPGVKDFLSGYRGLFNVGRWRSAFQSLDGVFRKYAADPSRNFNILSEGAVNFFKIIFPESVLKGFRVGFTAFGRIFTNIFAGMLRWMIQGLTKAMRGFTRFLVDKNYRNGLVRTVTNGMRTGLTTAGTMASDIMEPLMKVFSDGSLIDGFVTAFKTLGTALYEHAIKPFGIWIGEKILEAINTIFGTGFGTFGELGAHVSSSFSTAKEGVVSAFSELSTKVNDWLDNMKAWGSWLLPMAAALSALRIAVALNTLAQGGGKLWGLVGGGAAAAGTSALVPGASGGLAASRVAQAGSAGARGVAAARGGGAAARMGALTAEQLTSYNAVRAHQGLGPLTKAGVPDMRFTANKPVPGRMAQMGNWARGTRLGQAGSRMAARATTAAPTLTRGAGMFARGAGSLASKAFIPLTIALAGWDAVEAAQKEAAREGASDWDVFQKGGEASLTVLTLGISDLVGWATKNLVEAFTEDMDEYLEKSNAGIQAFTTQLNASVKSTSALAQRLWGPRGFGKIANQTLEQLRGSDSRHLADFERQRNKLMADGATIVAQLQAKEKERLELAGQLESLTGREHHLATVRQMDLRKEMTALRQKFNLQTTQQQQLLEQAQQNIATETAERQTALTLQQAAETAAARGSATQIMRIRFIQRLKENVRLDDSGHITAGREWLAKIAADPELQSTMQEHGSLLGDNLNAAISRGVASTQRAKTTRVEMNRLGLSTLAPAATLYGDESMRPRTIAAETTAGFGDIRNRPEFQKAWESAAARSGPLEGDAKAQADKMVAVIKARVDGAVINRRKLLEGLSGLQATRAAELFDTTQNAMKSALASFEESGDHQRFMFDMRVSSLQAQSGMAGVSFGDRYNTVLEWAKENSPTKLFEQVLQAQGSMATELPTTTTVQSPEIREIQRIVRQTPENLLNRAQQIMGIVRNFKAFVPELAEFETLTASMDSGKVGIAMGKIVDIIKVAFIELANLPTGSFTDPTSIAAAIGDTFKGFKELRSNLRWLAWKRELDPDKVKEAMKSTAKAMKAAMDGIQEVLQPADNTPASLQAASAANQQTTTLISGMMTPIKSLFDNMKVLYDMSIPRNFSTKIDTNLTALTTALTNNKQNFINIAAMTKQIHEGISTNFQQGGQQISTIIDFVNKVNQIKAALRNISLGSFTAKMGRVASIFTSNTTRSIPLNIAPVTVNLSINITMSAADVAGAVAAPVIKAVVKAAGSSAGLPSGTRFATVKPKGSLIGGVTTVPTPT